MEEEKLQPTEGWYPIVPTEEIPEEVDAWMVEIPNAGKLFVSLENKAGDDTEGEGTSFALIDELPGLVASGTDLNRNGFKTLSLALIPSNRTNGKMAEIRAQKDRVRFESFLQRSNDESHSPLKPLGYWSRSTQPDEEMGRDIMTRPERDQLEQIEIRFPEGGDN